jgi:putative redox protein
MTKLSTEITWTSGMAFRADVDGHAIMMDAGEQVGGQNLGARPKPLLLASLGGCTGMDIISILKKMRITPDHFAMKVEGEVTEEHPKQYSKIHITYEFRGKDLPMEQLKKAVDLSQDKYCGISATLSKAVEITTEIRILV